MLNSLLRAVGGFFRYLRPLINGAGLLLLLAVLGRAVLAPFVPHRDDGRFSDPQTRNLKPVVPVLEIRKIDEVRRTPDRLRIRTNDVPEARDADMAFGLDSSGGVLDSFPVRLQPEPPRVWGGLDAEGRPILRARKATAHRAPLAETMRLPSVDPNPEFEGRYDAGCHGKLKSVRFRSKGRLSLPIAVDDGSHRIWALPLGGNEVCGRFLVSNPSGKELKSVQFRVDLVDSTGALVRTDAGRSSTSQIGAKDTVVIENVCARLEPRDQLLSRHLRIKATEAQVERSEWMRLVP
ncbi:MAG: hypothetical protein RL318_850 [Fibrobacterota bacterium]|jgi:hypothetical protein